MYPVIAKGARMCLMHGHGSLPSCILALPSRILTLLHCGHALLHRIRALLDRSRALLDCGGIALGRGGVRQRRVRHVHATVVEPYGYRAGAMNGVDAPPDPRSPTSAPATPPLHRHCCPRHWHCSLPPRAAECGGDA